jgi:hypothetical protein
MLSRDMADTPTLLADAAPAPAAPSPSVPANTVAPPAPATAATDPAEVKADAAPNTDAVRTAEPKDVPLELKLPEGFEPGAGLDEFKGLAKELGLKPEAAQKLVDFQAKQALAEREQMEKLHAGWLQSMKADKEFGGVQFDANAQLARKAMLKFATPELRTFLNESGLGDHPELVRLMYRVGKAIGEDSIAGVTSAPPGPTEPDPQARLRALYPTMFQKES